MKKITLETTKVGGVLFYELKVDGKPHQGTYVFENALSEWINLKDKLQFVKNAKDEKSEDKK